MLDENEMLHQNTCLDFRIRKIWQIAIETFHKE